MRSHFSLLAIASLAFAWCAARAAEPGTLPAKSYTRAEALRIGWPQLAGPLGTFEALPLTEPLVGDLSQAKRLWKSECHDLGRAKGGSKAFRNVSQFTADAIAKHGSHPGSWAGPIVADGLVFCASFRPTGEWANVQGHRVRLDAEDFVVAIDALTGKTRWLTAEPGGILKGGGKRQGFQVGPVYHAGVVYSLGSTARLLAHDAKSGAKLWESDAHPARAAQKKARADALASVAQGKWSYVLTPNWCSSLVVAEGVLIVPDQSGGLLGVELKSGKKLWLVAGAIARWATPSVWSHAGKQYVLCANDKGDLRLIDPASGKELWKLGGLGPNWFTLAPGKTHVLVNVAADSGKTRGAERKSGRLGAIKLSTAQGERAWMVAESYRIPVWMDSGARMRVLYRDGKFLLPNSSEEEADDGDEDAKPSAQASAEKAGKRSAGPALLIDEATGKVLSTLPPQGRRDDNLAGLIYWTGDRVLSRGDSYHGPKHGGRHPWSHWTTAGDKLEPLPNKMDLSEFTNAYEVAMETPLVGGLMFERTEDGGLVCYELCAK